MKFTLTFHRHPHLSISLLTCWLFCLFSATSLQGQTILYSEDFNSQLLQGFTGPVAAGTTYNSSNGKWSVSSSSSQGIFDANDHARVEDNVVGFSSTTLPSGLAFQFRDVDEPTTWRSQSINISSYTTVNLGIDVFEVGSFESTDSIVVAYILDGQRTVIFRKFDDYSDADGTGASSSSDPGNINPLVLRPTANGLSGSTLQIEVIADCNSATEFHHIDNVSVEGFGFIPDNTPPVITGCPANVILYADMNCQAQIGDFTSFINVVDNVDPAVSISQSPPAGTMMTGAGAQLGLVLTATDNSGNSSTCPVTVILKDTTSPVFAPITGVSPVPISQNCAAVLPDYRGLPVSDACGVNTVVQSPAPGTLISSATQVTLTASDASFNSSSVTFTVPVSGSSQGDTTIVAATTCDLSQVGVSVQLFNNQFGCDSLVITTTTLLPSDTTTVVATTCDPSQVGVSQQVFTNQFGCDSVVFITTTLLPSDTTNVFATTCDPSQVGVSVQVFTNQFGCDSVVITTSTLLPSDTTNVVATTCDPNQVGVSVQVFSNQFGCDSVVISSISLASILANGPTNLTVSKDTAFVANLNWDDNSADEDGFEIYRNSASGGLEFVASVPANTTTYSDMFVPYFNENVDYYVQAIKAGCISSPSNTDYFFQPRDLNRLSLRYVCYDSNTDSLTWKIQNNGNYYRPVIWAQWWSTQQDTVWAAPNGDSYFKTKNNPQSGSTWGDDNITGIYYWVSYYVMKDHTRTNIQLSNSCSSARFEASHRAGQAHLGAGGPALEIRNVRDMGDELLRQSLTVAPNPTSSRVWITPIEAMDQEASYTLMDAMGRTFVVGEGNLLESMEINMSELAAGVYMLRIESGGLSTTHRVIKR